MRLFHESLVRFPRVPRLAIGVPPAHVVRESNARCWKVGL